MKPTPAQLQALADFHDKAAKAYAQLGKTKNAEQAKRRAQECRAKAK